MAHVQDPDYESIWREKMNRLEVLISCLTISASRGLSLELKRKQPDALRCISTFSFA